MSKFFVYYNDDCGSENTGLEEFDTAEQASEFITKRMAFKLIDNPKVTLTNYTVIEGTAKTLHAVEQITRILIN